MAGSTVTFQVAATATHLGRFEFRVCAFEDHEATSLTQECLDARILQPAPGESASQSPDDPRETISANRGTVSILK